MKEIDENLLSSYLEGNLDEEQAQEIEELIETNPELLALVEEWVTVNDTICSSLQRDQSKADTSSTNDAIRYPNHFRAWKTLLIAASILAFISIPAILIINNSTSPNYKLMKNPSNGNAWTPNENTIEDTIHLEDTINKK